MSLIPAFEIGLWNAWIFMVLFLAAAMAFLSIYREKTDKRCEGEPTWSEMSATSKVVLVITHMMILPLALIYSVLLPLKLGTPWFYVGLAIYLLAIAMGTMFGISFATAPLGEPMSKGIYAISRHPSYFSYFLACIAIGIACASWVFLLIGLVWIVSWHFGVKDEERILLDRYGDAYREYMDRTPRWIGFPRRK